VAGFQSILSMTRLASALSCVFPPSWDDGRAPCITLRFMELSTNRSMAESHQEKVVRLIAERSGKGKGPLSADDRLAILTQMRDDSLCWAAQCASECKATGSGAARELYDFAHVNITQLENEAHAGATTRVPWIYSQFPMDSTGPEALETVN